MSSEKKHFIDLGDHTHLLLGADVRFLGECSGGLVLRHGPLAGHKYNHNGPPGGIAKAHVFLDDVILVSLDIGNAVRTLQERGPYTEIQLAERQKAIVTLSASKTSRSDTINGSVTSTLTPVWKA